MPVLDQVYECITRGIDLATVHIPHSDVYYARAALEDAFPDLEFSTEQVEELLTDEYGWDKNSSRTYSQDNLPVNKQFVDKYSNEYRNTRKSENPDEGQWSVWSEQTQTYPKSQD